MKIIATYVGVNDGKEDTIFANGDKINSKRLDDADRISYLNEYRPTFHENTGTIEECLKKVIHQVYIVLFSSKYGRVPESPDDFAILRNFTYNP